MFNKLLTSLATNVRVGHATNSSSTHSIILTHDRVASQEETDDYFGWNSFILADAASKRSYLGNMLAQHFSEMFSPKEYDGEAMQVMNDHCLARARAIIGDFPSQGIDHQSTWSFPRDEHGDIHVEFVKWLLTVFEREDLVVLGGNDNDDDGRPSVEAYAHPIPLPHDEFQSKPECLDRGTYWLIWYPESGLKLRINKDVTDKRTLKGSHPELIDVKVTDYCDAGCTYCYQGSTTAGKHASIKPGKVADLFHGLGPVEIAIGGGEPLLWPDLETFIWNVTQQRINANVTTRRPDLITAGMYRSLKGIGISADNLATLKSRVKVFETKFPDDRGYQRPNKLVIHIVVGSCSDATLRAMLTFCGTKNIPVLLLGYKTDGRGASVAPKKGDWISVVKDMPIGSRPRIGVDTQIVKEHGAEIVTSLRVDRRLMTNAEGMHSMYLDLVEQTYAKASYGDVERKPIPPGEAGWRLPHPATAPILETFATWL